MTPLCPECMGTLAATAEGTFRCTIHGASYRILFQRHHNPVPPVLSAMSSSNLPPDLPGNNTGAPASENPPQVLRCVQHPNVPATHQCQVCGAHMCSTCDFALPGGMHLCPACATKPQTDLSDRRKRARNWAYVCAAIATSGIAALFAGAFVGMVRESGTQVVGVILSLWILIPSVIGLAQGLGAVDRRLANPPSLWIAAGLNGLMVLLFLLLTVVGLFKGG